MEYSIEEFDRAKTKVMNYIMYKKRTEKEIRQNTESTHPLFCFPHFSEFNLT